MTDFNKTKKSAVFKQPRDRSQVCSSHRFKLNKSNLPKKKPLKHLRRSSSPLRAKPIQSQPTN